MPVSLKVIYDLHVAKDTDRSIVPEPAMGCWSQRFPAAWNPAGGTVAVTRRNGPHL